MGWPGTTGCAASPSTSAPRTSCASASAIGKPPGGKERGGDHVLSRLPARQRELFDVAVQEAADAVELIVTDGVDVAMRTYNRRDAPA